MVESNRATVSAELPSVAADDIDPWFERGYGYAISDKASAVGSTASEMKIFARLRISKDL
jgi:hypothetical protein